MNLCDGDEHMIPLAGIPIQRQGKEQAKSDDTELTRYLAGRVAASMY